jgi:hypothetical protein
MSLNLKRTIDAGFVGGMPQAARGRVDVYLDNP